MTVQDSTATSAGTSVPRYSGKAVLAFPVGLVAVFLPAPFNMLLGGIAVLIAGAARRELRRDKTLRGTAFALLGLLLGAGVFLVQIAPLVMAYGILALSNLVP